RKGKSFKRCGKNQVYFKGDEKMKKAYYGEFGGQFLPESAMFALNELEDAFLKFAQDKAFKKELQGLLATYVGRPTPLYFARNLSKKYG
ncbi:hypothetical protein QRX53_35555, partial [Pseudomonas aeruginosa]|nr:hypothetical protein [Pseudomonas aeruginosa]